MVFPYCNLFFHVTHLSSTLELRQTSVRCNLKLKRLFATITLARLLLIDYLWKVTTGNFTLRTRIIIMLVDSLIGFADALDVASSIVCSVLALSNQTQSWNKNSMSISTHMYLPSTRKTVSFTNHTATPTSNINVLSTHNNPSSRSFIKKPRFFAILHALIISPRLSKNQCQFKLIIICLLFASTLGWSRMTKIRCGCYSILDPLWTLVTWTTIFG